VVIANVLQLKAARATPTLFTAPHGMQTRLAMRIMSVCLSLRLSVRLSHAWIVTKRYKDLSRFIYHMKEHLA